MQNRWLMTIGLGVVVLAGIVCLAGSESYFGGQDLHLNGKSMTVYSSAVFEDGAHVMLFENGFSMSVGANELFSDRAIVWLNTVSAEYRGVESIDYNAQVYLDGNVSVKQGKGSKTTDISQITVEQGSSLLARFMVTGEVFATAEEQEQADLSKLQALSIYKDASVSIKSVVSGPRIVKEAMVPGYGQAIENPVAAKPPEKPLRLSDFFGGIEENATDAAEDAAAVDEAKEDEGSKFLYPVNIAGLWEQAPKIETTSSEADGNVATIIGRFYLWQKQDEEGGMLEFQADNAVMFYKGKGIEVGDAEQEGVVASGALDAIYLQGNIVMTEGERTIRADEIYYDFENRRAIAVNAEMRKFDAGRGVPIYLRAEKLRKVSDNVFQADKITLTTSEFYLPQVSMTASEMVLTDLTGVEARAGKAVDDSKYDGVLYDVRMKGGAATFFRWPRIRTNFERPDVPIKRASVGDSGDNGFSVETQWYMSRVLGYKEPEGVDSSLLMDHFSERGFGAGAVIEYERKDYFGWVSSYIIRDEGEDDLGRTSTRKNQEPDNDVRGRFTTRHRHYLPYDWQATFEISYLSDKNFMESFYRREFNLDKSQETLLHLKRLKDNWAFSFLAKVRINDFQEETEELPTIEFHRTGQSFWDHRLTYYSATQLSRFKNRYGSKDRNGFDTTVDGHEQFYTYFSTRHEVDMPLTAGPWKVVPYVAGTYGFDDQDGFMQDLDNHFDGREDHVMLGEGGVRMSTMFSNANNSIKSERWDLDGIRHIVVPHTEASVFAATDNTMDMREIVNFGVSQRWQTHRGVEGNKRTLDWMRLDLDATFLNDSLGPEVGPAKFIWNNPVIPTLTRRGSGAYGIMRNSLNADYMWRLSDTTTILSDMNYDFHSGVVQQFNIGFARYVYPDLSYYLGNRYLRNVIVSVPADGVYEKGSSSFIASVTYALNERYTATFAQEYNFDYGKNVKTELTILRRYHRVYYGLTFGVDESRNQTSIMFSVWPQGVKELAFGSRKYTGLSETGTED